MVAFLVIALILCSIYYAYTNHHQEFTATASAIQQIWTGTCRLSCRNDGVNGFSGLSGAVPGQDREFTVFNSGPSSVCVCESCPCKLLENLLRTCSPVTNIYTRIVEFVSDCYYDLVKTLTDLFNYVDQVMRCSTSCQRQAQLMPVRQLNSGVNITFDPTKEEYIKEKLEKNEPRFSRTIAFNNKPASDDLKQEATSSKTSENVALSKDVSDKEMPEKSSAESEKRSDNCSKCIEKGKICIGTCPREKKH